MKKINFKKVIERINYRIVQLGLKKVDIGRAIGKSDGYYTVTEKRNSPKILKDIDKIAKILSCSVEYLMYGIEEDLVRDNLQVNNPYLTKSMIEQEAKNGNIALANKKQVCELNEAHLFLQLNSDLFDMQKQYIYAPPEHAKESIFYVSIKNESMSPKINLGDKVVADSSIKPKFGSIVIARLLNSEENLIAYYFESEDHITLKFANETYPDLKKKTDEISVIAVAIQKISLENLN